MSARKRKMSRRLDLPAALGPTTNRRSPTSNSTFLKFRQLLAARCVIFIGVPVPLLALLCCATLPFAVRGEGAQRRAKARSGGKAAQ